MQEVEVDAADGGGSSHTPNPAPASRMDMKLFIEACSAASCPSLRSWRASVG